MLIDVYKDYLKDKASPGTIGTYARALEKILESGYSEADLLGSVSQLVKEYRDNPGKKNRRNTIAALKWLRRYKYRNCASNFFIYHKGATSTWRPVDVHATEYRVDATGIDLTYSDLTRKRKPLGEDDLFELLDLLRYYEMFLSDSGLFFPAPTLLDYSPEYYDYCYGRKAANHVESLFENSKNAVAAYNKWAERVIYGA